MDALAELLGAIDVLGHAGLLEGEDGLYVVHVGAVDDRAIIGLVERWAAVRRRYAGNRCIAVVVAERVEARYRTLLAVIESALRLTILAVREEGGVVRFSEVELR